MASQREARQRPPARTSDPHGLPQFGARQIASPREDAHNATDRRGNAATAADLHGDAAAAGMPWNVMYRLQGMAGNRAVSRFIAAQRDTEEPILVSGEEPSSGGAAAVPAPDPYGALDDADFNAGQIANDLIRAIDQKVHTADISIEPDDSPAGKRFGLGTQHEHVENERRKVDVPAVIKALDHRTVSQITEVERRYQEFEHRTGALEADLFGGGESGRKADITPDQQSRIRALLQGTGADPIAPDLQAELATYPPALAARFRTAISARANDQALQHQLEADAIELHELFSADLDNATRERVMLLFRHRPKEAAALAAFYDLHFGVGALDVAVATRLSGLQRMRFLELRAGSIAKADAVAIEDKRRQIEALDEQNAQAESDGQGAGSRARNELGPPRRDDTERRALTADIEAIVEQNRVEAMSGSPSKEAGVAVSERLRAILGEQDGGLGSTVGSELVRTLGTEQAAAITASTDPWLPGRFWTR
jgi:hypothetical protein